MSCSIVQLTLPGVAACMCVVQGGLSRVAGQNAQQADGFAPGQHLQSTCIPLLLAIKHIAVVASTTRLSGLQLENNTNTQEKAHEMYLLYQQMRKTVGLLADVKVPQQSTCHFYSRIMQVYHKDRLILHLQTGDSSFCLLHTSCLMQAKKSVAKEQAVSRQLRQELVTAKRQLTQVGCAFVLCVKSL